MNNEEKNIKKKRQEEYRKILEQQIKFNEFSQRPYSTKENFKIRREKSNENIQTFTTNNIRNENYTLSNIEKDIQSENIFEESKLKRFKELSQINNNVTENNRDYNFSGKGNYNYNIDKKDNSNIQFENINSLNNENYPSYMDPEYYSMNKEPKTDLFDNLLICNEKDLQRKKKLEYQLELKKQIEENKKRKEDEKLKIKKEEDDFYKKYGNEFQYFSGENIPKKNNKDINKNDEKYLQTNNNINTYIPIQEIKQDSIEYSNLNKIIEKSINENIIIPNNVNSNEQNIKDYNFTNNNIFELINEQKKLIIEYQKTLEKIREEKNEAEASCKYFSEQAQLQKINKNIHYKSKYEELNETEIEIDKSLNCETKLIKINSHNENNLIESWYDNSYHSKILKNNCENKNINNERNKINLSKRDIKNKNEERYNDNKLIHRRDENEKFDKIDSKNEINLSYNLNLDDYNEIREQEKFKSKANFFDDNEIKLKDTKNEPIIQSKFMKCFQKGLTSTNQKINNIYHKFKKENNMYLSNEEEKNLNVNSTLISNNEGIKNIQKDVDQCSFSKEHSVNYIEKKINSEKIDSDYVNKKTNVDLKNIYNDSNIVESNQDLGDLTFKEEDIINELIKYRNIALKNLNIN